MVTESPSTSSRLEHVPRSTIQSSLPALPSRCTQCNARHKENARNLVVCIDGTSNQFGHNVMSMLFFNVSTHSYGQNTNVVKLFAKIELETSSPEQFAYYSSGIGTRPKSMHVFERMERAFSDKFDMAVAWFVLVTIPNAAN
ncbi:hypothetical protein JVU11DRAFT_10739 [Chiua virens]|nr:hypothetical protein JVU11DRAFT_10739 [Chiua virens]